MSTRGNAHATTWDYSHTLHLPAGRQRLRKVDSFGRAVPPALGQRPSEARCCSLRRFGSKLLCRWWGRPGVGVRIQTGDSEVLPLLGWEWGGRRAMELRGGGGGRPGYQWQVMGDKEGGRGGRGRQRAPAPRAAIRPARHFPLCRQVGFPSRGNALWCSNKFENHHTAPSFLL